jgi:hypothetical protein
MADRANAQRNAAKWALAGALALVLVAVVAWQFAGSGAANQPDAAASSSESADRPGRRLPRRFPAKGFSLTASAHAPTKWPTIPLAKAMAHDPFAPEALPADVAAASAAAGDELAQAEQAQHAAMLAETLDAMRQRGVTMVLHTADGPVATIGDRTIKVGDMVGEYRVTEIDADGVVLEPTPPK